jgi:hypothetical protein
MKKPNKKINVLAVIFVSVAVMMTGVMHPLADNYRNYYDIEMTLEEYQTLLELGFTEREIYYMDERTFEDNRYSDAELLGTATNYYKVIYPAYGIPYAIQLTEQQYYDYLAGNVMEPLGTIHTSYKTMTSSISKNGSYYRYKNILTWDIIPSHRNYDIIGVGFDDDVAIASTVYFNYTYIDNNGYHSSGTFYNRKSTTTGGSAVYLLPTGTLYSLDATIYYDVQKDTSATINSLSICGDYSHATSDVNLTNVGNYAISYAGIGLGSGLAGHYDSIDCAYTSIGVTW